MIRKSIADVTEAEFRRFPVWRYTQQDGPDDDETTVVPIAALPCPFAVDLVLATGLTLANGMRGFGVLYGLSPRPEVNEHLLTAAIYIDGALVRLARCYDLDFAENGPAALAARLGLDQSEVFPIGYDVSGYFRDGAAGFRGEVLPEPRERLSEAEFIELALKADL